MLGVDNIKNIIRISENHFDNDEFDSIEESIKRQYINFENLGVNLIENIEDERFVSRIYSDIIEYVNENYTSVTDYDETIVSNKKLIEIGNYVYMFICVDGFNIIIPNFLQDNDCSSIKHFDTLLSQKFKNNPTFIKANLLKVIKNIIIKLRQLQKLDSGTEKDENYNNLLTKFLYYINLVDFGNTEKIIYNYIRPILNKHFNDIVWRIA